MKETETQKITVRIDPDLYEKMRLAVFKRQFQSQTEIINLALAKFFMALKHDETE